MMERVKMKSALESMLFVWGEPLEIRTAAAVFETEPQEVEAAFEELQQEYQQRAGGILLQRFGDCFQLCTSPENRAFLERLCNPVKEKKLSRSAMETLAIVAYKQPVTRGEIESVRGVKCGRIMEGLLQKGLIKEMGRSEAIGRPVLFGTTELFLRYIGIESLEELPELESGSVEDHVLDEGAVEQLSFESTPQNEF